MFIIQAGARIPPHIGAYTNATITSVAKNGWCKCKWDDGREFNARTHWINNALITTPTKGLIIPS